MNTKEYMNEHVIAMLRACSKQETDSDKSNRLMFASFQEENLQAGEIDTRTYEEFMSQPTYGDDDYDASWMEE